MSTVNTSRVGSFKVLNADDTLVSSHNEEKEALAKLVQEHLDGNAGAYVQPPDRYNATVDISDILSVEYDRGFQDGVDSVPVPPPPPDPQPSTDITVSLNGGDQTLNVDDAYIELGAEATGPMGDGVSIHISGVVDTTTAGTYTVTYTATDTQGNVASAVRTVDVVAGGASPLLGINNISYIGAFTVPSGYAAYMLGKGKDTNTLYCQTDFDSLGVISNPGAGGTATEDTPAVNLNSDSNWLGSVANLPTSSGFYYYAPTDSIFYSHYDYYPSGHDQAFAVQRIDPNTLLPVGSKHRITGGQSPQMHMGNFGPVPVELQAELGGDTFRMGGPNSITGYTSNGISVMVFDGSQVDGSGSDIVGTVLSEYDEDDAHALFGGARFGGDGTQLAETTAIDGGAFIEGTRTFMAWGGEGTGVSYYGTSGQGGPADPCFAGQGVHAYPYRGCIFFFNVDDFVKVKNGQEPVWYPVPYNRQDGLPFECRGDELPNFPLSDGCGPYGYQVHTHYDPDTKRFYVGDNSDQAYVFQVTLS